MRISVILALWCVQWIYCDNASGQLFDPIQPAESVEENRLFAAASKSTSFVRSRLQEPSSGMLNLPETTLDFTSDTSQFSDHQQVAYTSNNVPVPDSFSFQSTTNGGVNMLGGYSGCGEGCVEPDCGCCRCLCDECGDSITFYGGVSIMSRVRPKSQLLVSNPAFPTQNLNANDFQFGVGAGFEAGMIAHRVVNNQLDLDVRFQSFGTFSDTANRFIGGNVGRINMSTPIDIVGPRNATGVYDSALSGIEVNLRHRMGQDCDWVTLVAGFRYLNLSEQLSVMLVDPNGILADEGAVANVANQLYGFQIGSNHTLAGGCCYCIEGYWRAGIYGNDSSGSTDLISFVQPPTGFSAGGNHQKASFVGEAGAKIRYAISENIRLYGRYQVLALSGVSVASEQLGATDMLAGTGHSANGTAIFHGAVVGLELVY